MARKNLNWTMKQGTYEPQTLTFESAPGVPIDVSGYTFSGMGRRDPEDAMKAFDLAFDMTNAVTGEVIMYVDEAVSSALDLTLGDTFKYDAEYINADGRTIEACYGQIKMIREITR